MFLRKTNKLWWEINNFKMVLKIPFIITFRWNYAICNGHVQVQKKALPWNWFKPSSKIFYWPFQGGTSFVDLLRFFCLVFARLFICALWSPAGKKLNSWLLFVVSNCECVTFQLVSWVRCGTWLYWFLIFAPLLTFSIQGIRLILLKLNWIYQTYLLFEIRSINIQQFI